jgi:hypothetical protein
VDTSEIEGVDADLRVRPFFRHGGTMCIREFVVGAEERDGARDGRRSRPRRRADGSVTTPGGMVLNGLRMRSRPAAPGRDVNADVGQRTALVDYLEFYL